MDLEEIEKLHGLPKGLDENQYRYVKDEQKQVNPTMAS